MADTAERRYLGEIGHRPRRIQTDSDVLRCIRRANAAYPAKRVSHAQSV